MRPIVAIIVLALPLTAMSAFAADRIETVTFTPGSRSATLQDGIMGYDGVTFRLDAAAGQSISVQFDPDNASCYFNLIAPGSDEAVFNSSVSGNAFTGRLAQTGTYQVTVYLMRNAARRNERCDFSIAFGIS